MFGAYQAGIWAGLSEYFQPDLVVGASVGSLNGWAIAGGCSPEALKQRWLKVDTRAAERFRLPRGPLDGILGSDHLEEWTRELAREFQPSIPYGLVLTQLPRLRPILVQAPEVTWRHLAGSCAVPGLLRQQRIDGILYSDGGLLSAMPIWAAEAMGADKIIGVNIMLPLPRPVRQAMRFIRDVRSDSSARRNVPKLVLAPDPPLGSAKGMAQHRTENAIRWIDRGYADALAAREQIVQFSGS
jgi:NTE family protein